MLNKVMLIGHLGKDPELKYGSSGNPVCTMTLATDEGYQEFKKRAPSIYESIKAKSTLSDEEINATVADEPGKITADVQSTKLRQLLDKIKQG